MSIGTNIYMLRKEKKITQAYLAEKLGVSEQSISKWENDQCSPDVSLFPIIANYFGVSIDRIFGYHTNSYEHEVEKIVKAADDSMDTYKEIEIISEGLKKYPNSAELKIYLSFSLSMVNRISKDERERSEAVKKAIKLCQEVVDSCGDVKQVDRALNMLIRIYNETQNYSKAEECISKISAERYDARIVGMSNMLARKKCYAEQEEYVKNSLWNMYWTMSHIFEHIINTFINNSEYKKALDFLDAYEKLLSIFDNGCPDFYVSYKITACEIRAKTYMKMDNKEKCLEELKRFFSFVEQVKKVAKSDSFDISVRNPMYFSDMKDENLEEYIPDIHPEKIFFKYDAFFGNDESYQKFKNEASA